jgi:hypothetical protein
VTEEDRVRVEDHIERLARGDDGGTCVGSKAIIAGA